MEWSTPLRTVQLEESLPNQGGKLSGMETLQSLWKPCQWLVSIKARAEDEVDVQAKA